MANHQSTHSSVHHINGSDSGHINEMHDPNTSGNNYNGTTVVINNYTSPKDNGQVIAPNETNPTAAGTKKCSLGLSVTLLSHNFDICIN